MSSKQLEQFLWSVFIVVVVKDVKLRLLRHSSAVS